MSTTLSSAFNALIPEAQAKMAHMYILSQMYETLTTFDLTPAGRVLAEDEIESIKRSELFFCLPQANQEEILKKVPGILAMFIDEDEVI